MKKKSKWKIKRIIVALVILAILGFLLTNLIISFTPYGKLRKLDYTKEVIKSMSDSVQERLIELKLYSKTVDQALTKKIFVEKNLELYISIEYKDTKNYIEDMNKLVLLGYDNDTIKRMYKNLDITEIDKIIKLGYIKDINEYITVSYFRIDNLSRYMAYKTKTERQYDVVMTNVNIGLDKDYYDDEIVQTVSDTKTTLILVNKYNKLPDGYEPTDLTKISDGCAKEASELREDAALAFENLCAASIADGAKVLALSAYRSYKTQQSTWDSYMKSNGSSYTYYYVAKPGFSEHQTGLALDLASGSVPGKTFSYTKDYTWTINNAYKYGFIVRYEEGKESITGYNFEPWHIRYVGVDIAKYIHDHDITFDEYIATK